ncbi:MAG: Taurine import ATP-binding protein TauB [Peptostreptococcus russellii]|uniref:ABC transporter ATP-binding protein n=1 Tax=Peptostreptococcus russellii TaxID=215200 RepID=A0A2P7Q1L6_9FIRM|nr:ABC transporter ATP-binding protein [Peptostreptococcus russellii]PSJ31852.1 ABC transporter ATP-binding protein [Peptostreptococcus russellii]
MNSYQKKSKVDLKNVYKSFGSTDVLENINIELKEGELVSIVGPSGCGKSTIFNILTDLIKLDKGKAEINGEVSYMYQKDLLLPYKTILDNVSLPLQINGVSKKKAREEALSYFEVFDLQGYENSYPHELSGGMKQRANFLRTFICSNDIMLLDEPFGALDSITKRSIQEWFLHIRKKVNSTILLITHDIDEAIMLSDRIYVLSNKPARIKEEFDLNEDIFNKEDLEKRALLKEKIIELLR